MDWGGGAISQSVYYCGALEKSGGKQSAPGACALVCLSHLADGQSHPPASKFHPCALHEAAAALTAPAADGVTFSSSLDSAPPMLISLHQRAREYCRALEPPRIEPGGSFFTCPPPRRPPDANARSSRCDCRCRTAALQGSATRLAESTSRVTRRQQPLPHLLLLLSLTSSLLRSCPASSPSELPLATPMAPLPLTTADPVIAESLGHA